MRTLRLCVLLAVVCGGVIGHASMRPVRAGGTARDARADTVLSSDEYSVKAAFVHKFARYVQWPAEAFDGTDAPLIVGVLGKHPFDKKLELALEDKRVGRHPLVLVHFATRAALGPCHLLVVPREEEAQLDAILERYADRPVLMVTDSLAGARRGAHVGFYLEKSKVRFAINDEAAKRDQLAVSSELLKLAKLVKSGSAAQ